MADSPESPIIRQLIEDGLFDRLPPTFTAYFYDQISGWDLLFPAEKQYFERLFGLLDRSDAAAVEKLFAPLRRLEDRMEINSKNWNPRTFDLSHVDFLNRSPYLSEWRSEIRRIFSEIDPLLDEEISRTGNRRLVVIIAPPELPVGVDRMWTRLRPMGSRVSLEVDAKSDFVSELLRGPGVEKDSPTLMESRVAGKEKAAYDAWLIEAGDELGAYARKDVVRLSYRRLEDYRQELMGKVDRAVKDESLSGPRELGRRLQTMRVRTGDDAIDTSPVLSEFLRAVMLNGNGTLLINNTFVEWAAAQAARRARPRIAVISFGVRNKMKPFSSLLIYADQDKANIIPSQADVLATYVDLEVFYLYVWKSFEEYPEYRGKTAYLFCGEHLDEMFVIAPPEFPPLSDQGRTPLAQLHADCEAWLSR